MQITKHKSYDSELWNRWRKIKNGGDDLIEEFLIKRTSEESDQFKQRKDLAFDPGDAASAIQDVINTLAQRITSEVSRTTPSETMREVINGLHGGVDLRGSTLGNYVARMVLPELLYFSKVGVLVDSPRDQPISKPLDPSENHPYFLLYTIENIFNYSYRGTKLSALLLQDVIDVTDPITGLYKAEKNIFKLYQLEDGDVVVTFYDQGGVQINIETLEPDQSAVIRLGIPEIPFHIFDIKHSLLRNIDKMHLAQLNLESSDVKWLWRGNVPIYVQKRDKNNPGNYFTAESIAGSEAEEDLNTDTRQVVKFGDSEGIEYPEVPPGFIAPPTDPIRVSMEKQEQIRRKIRQTLALTIQDIQVESARGKEIDVKRTEAGIAAIGRELEVGENRITYFYTLFTSEQQAIIHYPEKYELLSEEDRRTAVNELLDISKKFPTINGRKALMKESYQLLMSQKLNPTDLQIHLDEIDKAESTISDPTILIELVKEGISPKKIANELLGFPKDSYLIAEEEHARRVAAIQQAQSTPGARGVGDLSADPSAEARLEKQNVQNTDPADSVAE